VLAGWTPGIHLDETGRKQAARLGERLSGLPVGRVVSSPLERCRETAEELVPSGGEVVVDEAVGECRYGAWTGRPLKDLADEPLWRTVQDHPSRAAFPSSDAYAGESLAEMSHRAVTAVRRHDADVARECGDDSVFVVVSHGDVIKAVLADAVGCHLDHFQRFRADPASVSVVAYTSRRPFLVTANSTDGDLSWVRPRPPGDQADGPPPEAPDRVSGGASGDAVVGGGAG
jgi:probable phosphomutase (TIGR03848 family)